MPKSASFDVIGTCFDPALVISTITNRLGPLLAKHSVDPKTLFFSWFYAAQRDFTYLSLAGAYAPIASVLASTFKRACYVVDVPEGSVADADVDAIMGAFKAMGPRPGLKECWEGLRAAGWAVGAVTNGGTETSLGYFRAAGIEVGSGGAGDPGVLSCDEIKVAKPDVRVYENAMKGLDARGLGRDGGDERWFVAAHSWDLIAAKKAGFKTAYLTFEERDGVEALFGRFDVVAQDMRELLEKLKEV